MNTRKWLFINEFLEIYQSTEPPSPEDYDAVDAGILTIIEVTAEAYEPEDGPDAVSISFRERINEAGTQPLEDWPPI
jgi:hypothetical protein